MVADGAPVEGARSSSSLSSTRASSVIQGIGVLAAEGVSGCLGDCI
jgi:hypothetical protein